MFLCQDQFCDPVTVEYTGFTITWNKTLVGATIEVPCTGSGLNGTEFKLLVTICNMIVYILSY